MSFNIVNSIKGALSKASWILEKKSPEIMMGASIVASIGAIVTACKATIKCESINKQFTECIEFCRKCEDDGKMPDGTEYTHEDAKKDTVLIYTDTVKRVVVTLLPPIALEVASIYFRVKGLNIVSNHLAACGAAYAALNEKFMKEREAVRERLGEEEERKIFNGISLKDKDVPTGEVDKDGNPIMRKEIVEVADDDDYTILFDETSPCWDPDDEQNLYFLQAVQNELNELLRRRNGKPVTVNEVRAKLKKELTQKGQVTGWVYSKDPNHKGDNYIDLGIDKIMRAYRNMDECPFDRSYVLNLNVDGDILYAFG